MTAIMIIFILQGIQNIFGEGILSTDEVELAIALTPDESTAYVARHDGSWGSRENPPAKIYEYRREKDNWQQVGISSFSCEETPDNDSDIFISYDGEEAYFVSSRDYNGKIGTGPDIWKSSLEKDIWSDPEPVPNVNSAGYEASPVTDQEGNLYFSSIRKEGPGMGDFYIAKRNKDGSFDIPQLLPGSINSKHGEWNLVVSPDGEMIIFESSGREVGLSPYGDLYISYNKNGLWEKARSLSSLNTTGSDLNPRYLPRSNRLLYITSFELKNDNTKIIAVPFEQIIKVESAAEGSK